ncbi:Stem-specific protein TSJT1, partial [Mucuna pruriens]
MLGIFKEKLVNAPKELKSPASLNSCTKAKATYRTLRDRGPYPADQVLKELEGSFGFVIYDYKDRTVFVAS